MFFSLNSYFFFACLVGIEYFLEVLDQVASSCFFFLFFSSLLFFALLFFLLIWLHCIQCFIIVVSVGWLGTIFASLEWQLLHFFQLLFCSVVVLFCPIVGHCCLLCSFVCMLFICMFISKFLYFICDGLNSAFCSEDQIKYKKTELLNNF